MAGTAMSSEPAQEVGQGFRPTDQELVNHFLKLMILGYHYLVCRIPVVDIYQYEPWELPYRSGMSVDRSEWYLFCPRRITNGRRTSRQTKGGFWKSTGKDRIIMDEITETRIGKKKTLVYHRGRTPHGIRGNWIIHEYSATLDLANQGAVVLCKLMKKPDKNAKFPMDNGGKLSSKMASHSDNQRSDGNSNLQTPTYDEVELGYTSGYSCTRTGYEGWEPSSCVDFGFQNGDLHHKGDNSSPCHENGIICLMTSAYENNASCIKNPEELVVEQQPLMSSISYNEHYILNPPPESYMVTDTEQFLSVPYHGFGTSAAQSQPHEGGLPHGGNEQNCSPIPTNYDNHSPDAHNNLPSYNEGYVSGYGNITTYYQGGEPYFLKDFDFWYQNSYQNIAYSANDKPAMGCLVTSAYNNNLADIKVAEEAIGQQQPASLLFGHNDQDYCQNSVLGSYMPADNLFLADYSFSTAPSLSNEGRLFHGGSEHNYGVDSEVGTPLPTEQGLSYEGFNNFTSLSGYNLDGYGINLPCP